MELVPAFVNWGKELDHLVQVLLPYALGSTQWCQPLLGVEGSIESHLRALGQREWWNIDVLLILLKELFPFVHKKVIDTCPFPLVSDDERLVFSTSVLEHAYGLYCSTSVLEQYAGGKMEWPSFEWLHVNCFSALIELAFILPQKEDNLRNRITRVPCIDAKVASTHVLPALVTLGSDHNLNVKYVCIDAFGAVAQQFKNDAIVDKICIEMDAFLEDGSHEATLAVVRALASLMKPDLRENNALESETGRMCGDHDIDDGGNEIDELDLT
ncbi:hypothetical protein FXO38_24469 [Capsicum annuum]|uniref:Uncharacterized protein n=1 Tax=Capsicum annuum TaxID=4072 RepID=A0A2G2YX62_CAPAN|nr:hypothetical protein FXO38_24469 [Capsicum annuum]KAF3640518.1 hypothetical protein FXO37_23426 [Capsicum annuum]PHT74205.1 hypothetical protein T459_21482 [Capsicum annuum]